jgi:hypothetical protein
MRTAKSNNALKDIKSIRNSMRENDERIKNKQQEFFQKMDGINNDVYQ